tara:strand:+ start:7679 stop:8638 length:960 start_codon:yes stop_codon:yes gene_type:complete
MPHMEQPHVVRNTLIGLIAPAIWSSYALFACFLKSLPQFEVLALSYLCAFLSLSLIRLMQTKERFSQSQQPKSNFHAWIAVFSGVCLFQFFYLGAFRFAPPAHAELINYLWPIMVLFGSRLLSRQTFSPRYYISSGLCLMGLSALFLTQGQEQPRMEYWLGYLFAIGCAISWTFYSLSVRHGKGINDSLNAKVCLVGFFMSLCIHLGFESFQLPSIAALLGIVFSGCGVITLAYLSWEKGMKGGNITILTTFSYSVPILSIALLVLFNLTEPTWNLFFATILIAIAGCISMIQKVNFKWPLVLSPTLLRGKYKRTESPT